MELIEEEKIIRRQPQRDGEGPKEYPGGGPLLTSDTKGAGFLLENPDFEEVLRATEGRTPATTEG